MKVSAPNKASPLKASAASAQVGKAAASAVPAGKSDSSDEEEGRSAMVGKKTKKKKKKGNMGNTHPAAAADDNQTDAGNESGPTKEASANPAPSKGRKKAASYLDELLAERSKKRKKR